jgi:hypothetical protein
MQFRLTKTEKTLLLDQLRNAKGIGQALSDNVQAPPGVNIVEAIALVVRNLARRLRSKRTIDTTKLTQLEHLIVGAAIHNVGYLFERLWDRAMRRRITPAKYYALARVAMSLDGKAHMAGITSNMRSIRPLERRRS